MRQITAFGVLSHPRPPPTGYTTESTFSTESCFVSSILLSIQYPHTTKPGKENRRLDITGVNQLLGYNLCLLLLELCIGLHDFNLTGAKDQTSLNSY